MRPAELHRHLDGSMRRDTLVDLANQAGVVIKPQLGFHQGMGLAAALACFDATLSALQGPAAVRRVASEMCEDAAAEGLSALEVRFAPQLHKGASPQAIVDAAVEGLAGRAGLILCALYGEPPEVLEGLVDIAARTPAVVGIDLAGGPAPGHSWSMHSYARGFSRARELGLGRTVHAGEGRPPAEIRVAIEQLHAQRVGHGTTLLDDPEVLDLVLKRGVVIEACLTSNLQTGAIDAVAEHPLPRWLALGVKACVCADNTLLSGVDVPSELRLAAKLPGMTQALLQRAVACGVAGAFPRR